MGNEYFLILLLVLALGFLATGYPVALCLAGAALWTGLLGYYFGEFDPIFLQTLPERLYGVMTNESLMAIPLFILMGVILEKTKISEDLLVSMSKIFGSLRGGLGIAVCLVGAILAASTGIVGATVVTMGLISLPVMLKANYSPRLASGVICASGTLGQIIPPSIVLIILGDVISSSNQQAQLAMGNFSPNSVSVADLFVGALLPGAGLVGLYILYILLVGVFQPHKVPSRPKADITNYIDIFKSLLPPLMLILGVLGSILVGVATPTEAAAVGVMGTLLLSLVQKSFSKKTVWDSSLSTTKVTAMVFLILIGANVFSAVFRGFQGDEIVQEFLMNLSGNPNTIFWIVMLLIFALGFFIDFFEIVFVVVPVVGPILMQLGFPPVWLGVMIAMNLQTSFLTPPFGFSLFYLRGAAPKELRTMDIYKGAIPFLAIQVLMLVILFTWPNLVL